MRSPHINNLWCGGLKKQYQTPAGFIGNLVEKEEEFKKLNSQALMLYPTIEELLKEIEDGKADEFFEDKNAPFATWLVPKGGTLDTFKGGYQEYWQIERTAKHSFSKKIENEVATSEKDGQIVYEEEIN